MQSTLHACEREYKERYGRSRPDQRHAIHTLVEDGNEGISTPLAHIERLAFCEEFPDAEKVRHMQGVLLQGQEQRRTVEAHLLEVPQQSHDTNEDADYYAVLEAKALKLQNRVADIVKALAFQGADHAP